MKETTILSALEAYALEKGVNPDAIKGDTSDIIMLMAGADKFASSNVTVASPTSSKSYWGTTVSTMQTDVAVSNGKITGTLNKLTSGQLVTDWGEGYFLALKFTKNNASASSIKVGLIPSASNMPLQELDADMDGVFKITDKAKQKFYVRCSDGIVEYDIILDLSELVLN